MVGKSAEEGKGYVVDVFRFCFLSCSIAMMEVYFAVECYSGRCLSEEHLIFLLFLLNPSKFLL